MNLPRKLALAGFIVITLCSLAYIPLLWISMNLLSYPCEDPAGQLSCQEVVIRDFAYQVVPLLLFWLALAWLSFRKWGK
ncbi:hypothetical protein [Sphingomonas elodea]|uniref:hypothetical protein n=1 Tax=Sphingomonas elodea TaxID=179878 RepID=UPI001110AAC9|nr:hypothetical protein [Sphingomonas elodea]